MATDKGKRAVSVPTARERVLGNRPGLGTFDRMAGATVLDRSIAGEAFKLNEHTEGGVVYQWGEPIGGQSYNVPIRAEAEKAAEVQS